MSKTKVEVFTGGCPVCNDTVNLVNELACPNCAVTIYDLSKTCETRECLVKVKSYGISSVPTVVVNGKIASCCEHEKPSREALLAAGIGRS